MKKVLALLLSVLLLLSCIPLTTLSATAETIPQPKDDRPTIRILSIGHSFSVDAMKTYMWDLFEAAGYSATIGYLYYPGCSLERQYHYIKDNTHSYVRYSKTSDGYWSDLSNTCVTDALWDEDWDIITFQPSPDYGTGISYNCDLGCNRRLENDYEHFNATINKVRDYLCSAENPYGPNEDVEFYYHLTWAFATDCKLWSFSFSNYDQMTMYRNLLQATKDYVTTNSEIKGVIPCATSIQNVRTSWMGDTFNEPGEYDPNKDGYHLNDKGDLVAAMTWVAYFTGKSATEFQINTQYSDDQYAAFVDAVDKAIQTPWAVTESAYPSEGDEPVESVLDTNFDDGSLGGWQSSSEISNEDGALKFNVTKDFGNIYQTLKVKANTDYVVTLKAKSAKGGSAWIKFHKGDWTGDIVQADLKNVGSDWKEYSFTMNSGNNTDINVLIQYAGYTDDGETFWFDDITIATVGSEEPDTPTAGEGLVNGGFENGSEGWELSSSATIVDDAHTGGGALQLSDVGTWVAAAQQIVSVQPNTNYVVKLWYKRLDGYQPFNLFFMNSETYGNLQVVDGQSWFNDGPGDWKERTIVVNTAEATSMIIRWSAECANDGILLIDDMQIYPEGQDPVKEERIRNGGFETGDLTNWNNLWGSCTVSFEPGHNNSKYAMMLETSDQWQQVRQDGIRVEPNTDYVLIGYVKNIYGMTFVIKDGYDMINMAECTIENDFSGIWVRYEIPFNSGNQTEVCVLMISHEVGGYGLFDDIQIYKKGEEPEAPDEPIPVEGPMKLDSYFTGNNRPASPEANLILNGSFEEDEGGQWQSILSNVLSVVEDETAPEGNKSLYFNTSGVYYNNKAIFYIDVEPNTDYVFSAWVKGAFISDTNRFKATFGVIDYKNRFLTYSDHLFSNKDRQIVPTCWDNEWHLRAVSFNSGVNSRIGIAITGGYSQMWLDGIALYKAEDGVRYTDERQSSYIYAYPLYDGDGSCAESDNLIPDMQMNGTASQEFWYDAKSFRNGFISFAESETVYGTSMRYTASAKPCGIHAIKWIHVQPNTKYTFSVDVRILENGGGYLSLLDGKVYDYSNFLMVEFDKNSYGSDWFTVAIEFDSGAFDRIGIAVVDAGGEALMDNMRLFKSNPDDEGGTEGDGTEEIILGDGNGDGKVNNRDLVLLQRYLNDWDVTVNEEAADLYADGQINNRDLALLLRILNS